MSTFPEYRLLIFNSYLLFVPRRGTNSTWQSTDSVLVKQELLSRLFKDSNRVKFVDHRYLTKLENDLADNIFNNEKFSPQECGDDDFLLCRNIPEIAITNKDKTYNAIISPSYFFYSPEKEKFHIAWSKRRV